ncbi:hypothetical protein AB0H87_37970, partial [Asanoa sp. NPDC050611]
MSLPFVTALFGLRRAEGRRYEQSARCPRAVTVGPGGGRARATGHEPSHQRFGVTAHPELKLARWAAQELDASTVAATTMYTS